LREDIAVADYRSKARADDLDTCRVALKESDLRISCRGACQDGAQAALRHHREQLESYIRDVPAFLGALTPLAVPPRAPLVVRMMAEAGFAAGVGPMAAVAGTLAQLVGQHLLKRSPEVIVENGGDVFCRVARDRVIALDAGTSPFSWTIGIKVTRGMGEVGVCTSSGTRGGSLSFGRADAACAVAGSAALADAAATAIGNAVQCPDDIGIGLQVAEAIPGLRGAVIIVGEHIGAWGDIELVEIDR
jgi:ApbE superfamily uncharacterized protein (UPF0280 family)